jgi:hypothetical protein
MKDLQPSDPGDDEERPLSTPSRDQAETEAEENQSPHPSTDDS